MGYRRHCKSRGSNFFHGKGNENQLGTEFFTHYRIVSAVTRTQFVGFRVSHVALRGCWCNVVLNVHSPSEEKSDDSKDSFDKELDQVSQHFPKYHMNILLDFNAKLGREDIFKLSIQNKSLHQDSNDNGVIIVNITTSKNLVVKSSMVPHQNIHKYSWTSPDGSTHNQTDHTLIDGGKHSSINVV
jgi:hypothetical protein